MVQVTATTWAKQLFCGSDRNRNVIYLCQWPYSTSSRSLFLDSLYLSFFRWMRRQGTDGRLCWRYRGCHGCPRPQNPEVLLIQREKRVNSEQRLKRHRLTQVEKQQAYKVKKKKYCVREEKSYWVHIVSAFSQSFGFGQEWNLINLILFLIKQIIILIH